MLIFLVGLPGCGKTSLGKKLAQAVKYSFCDLDQWIESGERAGIGELFSKLGEAEFRLLESRYLSKVKNLDKAIVATGGGTPCFHNHMDLINAMGISIFLDVSPQDIAERLSLFGIEKRPILKGKTPEEIFSTLEQLRTVRLPYYARSHITLRNPDISFSPDFLRRLEQGS
jgi:shikimate kinase